MKTKILIALLVSGLAVAAGCAAGDETVRVGHEYFFKFYFLDGTHYLHLRADSTYSLIDREHMGVWESDGGVWSNSPAGEVCLLSTNRYQDYLRFPPLRTFVWYDHLLARLPLLRERIGAFLASDEAEEFPADAVRNILVMTNKACDVVLYAIDADSSTRKVSRDSLVGLAGEIDRYLALSNRYHRVCYVPARYKSHLFLVERDVSKDMAGEIERARGLIDEAGRGEDPEFVFHRIGRRQFLRESRRRQEFKYYPWMND